MQQYRQPTKDEVREWMRDLVASHKPPPEPAEIRERLWSEERERKQVLS